MRRIISIILGIAMIMAIAPLASAADYNFASFRASEVITVIPGSEGTGTIYFYNIDGDYTTHITLEVSQAPDNWQVDIEPPLQETQVDIDGKVVTILENLHVEPSEALAEEPDDNPEGNLYITIPGRGYALAKAATIIVWVPATEAVGKKSEIVISATAQFLGQSGAAAIMQARDFTFSVEVVPGITDNEKVIEEEITEKTDTKQTAPVETSTVKETLKEPSPVEKATEKPINVVETPEEPGDTTVDESSTVIERWLPVIVAAIIVVFGVLFVLFQLRRRHS